MTHDDALNTMAVERYKLDEMTPQQKEEFEEHMFECQPCCESMQAACEFVDTLRQLPKKEYLK